MELLSFRIRIVLYFAVRYYYRGGLGMSPFMEDLHFEFENMSVRLVATRNIPSMETAGIRIEETEAGKELMVNLWVAWELVEATLARFSDDGVGNEEWTQIHYRERFQPLGRPSPLPEKFYSRVHLTFSRLMKEARGDATRLENLNRLRGMFRDILESRIDRVVKLASAEAAASARPLQPEEVTLYGELFNEISSWRKEMRRLEAR